MSLPVDIFHWLLACLPILALLILMVKLKWKATKAAPVGVLIAAVSALLFFKAGFRLIAVEAVKGIWSALVVVLVIWTALLLYEVSNRANAFHAIQSFLQRIIPNELLQILAIGMGFVGFMIGITGFGVPVAVGAPLLIGIGVEPLYAVIISLLGEAWGSTFGTLAVAWDAMRLAVDLDSDVNLLMSTALWSGLFIWIWNFIIGTVICWLYGRKEGLRKGLPAIAVISLVQGGGQLLMSQLNQTIACFLPTCIALFAIIALSKTKLYSGQWRYADSAIMNRSGSVENSAPAEEKAGIPLFYAFLPYIILTVITLGVLLIPSVKAFLSSWKIGFPLPETATGYGFVNEGSASYSPISPLTHSSLFLLISAVSGALVYLRKGWIASGDIPGIVKRATAKTIPSGFSVIAFLVMSKIMSGSGQTMILAAGMADCLGRTYALFAPVVGLMGAFMTSSNMASNILFSDFQFTTASLLDISIPAVLGAQTAGGAIGTATCPGNIVLGCTTSGISGKEGDVMKKTLPVSIVAALLLGLLLLLLVFIL